MSQNDLNQKRGLFYRLGSMISSWNIFDRIAQSIENFFTFLVERTTLSFWFLLSLSLCSIIGLFTHNVRLIILAGSLWGLISLAFFGFAVFIHWLVVNAEQFFKPVADRASRSWVDRFLDTFFLFARRLTFTTAGLAIAAGHILTKAHIVSAVNLPEDESWRSWISWIFIGGAPLMGRLTDYFNSRVEKMEYQGGVVYLLGIIQFYSTFTILATGLIGGESAITAIYYVVREPILLIQDLFSADYVNTNAHAVYRSIGTTWFVILYLFVPGTFALIAHLELRKLKYNLKIVMPPLGLQALRFTGGVFLLIGLIVSWHEGWIAQLFLSIILIIIQLYHFISGVMQ